MHAKDNRLSSCCRNNALFHCFSRPGVQHRTKTQRGHVRLCIAPILLVDGGVRSGAFLSLGGASITHEIDLYGNVRLANNGRSFLLGIDLQWALARGTPALSLTTGAHVSDNIGLDGTLDLAFPVGRTVVIYGGLDADIDFTTGATTVPPGFFSARGYPSRETPRFSWKSIWE